MKKYFFIAILSIGMFTMAHAQTLDYVVYNASSTDTWHWAIDDAGPTPAIYELNIAPLTQRTGTIGFFSFPVDWKAVDNNNCYVTTTDFTPIPATILPTTCGTVTVEYKIVEIKFLNFKILK